MAIINTYHVPLAGWTVSADGVVIGVYPTRDAARFAARNYVQLDADPQDRLLAHRLTDDLVTPNLLRDAAERLIALSLENARLRAGKEAQ